MVKNDILLNEIKDYDFSRLESRFSKGITDFPLTGSFSSAKNSLIEIISNIIVSPNNIHTVTGDTFVIFREFVIMQKTYIVFCTKFFPKFYLNLSISNSDDQLVGVLKLIPNNNHRLSYFGMLKSKFKFGVKASSRISNIYNLMGVGKFSSSGEFKQVMHQYEAIAKLHNWSGSSFLVYNEFTVFFSLLQNTNVRLGMVSKKVDAMWHSFISDEQVYKKMCLSNGGKYIYHEDGTDESYENDFEDYITLLRAIVDNSNIFGEMFDEDIWPFPKFLVDKYGYSEFIEESNDNLVTKFNISSKSRVFKLVKLIFDGVDYHNQQIFKKYYDPINDDRFSGVDYKSTKSKYISFSKKTSSDRYQHHPLDEAATLILLDDAIISTSSNDTNHTFSCSSSSSTSSCSSSTSSCSSSSCSSSSCGSSCGGC